MPVGSSLNQGSVAVNVLQASDWRQSVGKRIPSAHHAHRVSNYNLMLLHQCRICFTCLFIISVIYSRGWKIFNGTASHHCHWYFCERNTVSFRLTMILQSLPQEHFPHLKTSALAIPAASAQWVSPCWPLALPLRAHTVIVETTSSFLTPIACVRLAPSAVTVRALSASVAHRETRSARRVAQEHFLRSSLAPNPAKPAPSALTARWRFGPACPTLTHSAWVSYKEELD